MTGKRCLTKADWCGYRWAKGSGICTTTENPHEAFGLTRCVSLEYQGTVHHCTREQAEEVFKELRLDK